MHHHFFPKHHDDDDDDECGVCPVGVSFGMVGVHPAGMRPMADRVLDDGGVLAFRGELPVWMWRHCAGHASGHDHHLRLRFLSEWDGTRLVEVCGRVIREMVSGM